MNWYWTIIYFMMMTVLGFILFDNIAGSLAFGIGMGISFGLIFSSDESKKKKG